MPTHNPNLQMLTELMPSHSLRGEERVSISTELPALAADLLTILKQGRDEELGTCCPPAADSTASWDS